MRLIPDWRWVLTRAWSVRLLILAGVLSGIEVILPFYEPYAERGVFAGLSFIVTAAAFIARIVAQREPEEKSE